MHNSRTLFTHLMNLPVLSDAFYHVDQTGPDGADYRIFLYRLASYSDWLHPDALESRGIMFRSEFHGSWDLVCRPMEKFHNLNENPFTMGLDISTAEYSMVKEDGSLISSYTGLDGGLYLKTKGSLQSDQAVAGMTWLKLDSVAHFTDALKTAEADGWTVNMEWVSPLNRIVVSYQHEQLVVLNARNRETGRYMDMAELNARFGEFTVALLNLPVHEVVALAQGEGIVAFFGNDAFPRFTKVKADAYLVLHRLKDGVNQPNALFEAVALEAIDDLRAAFADDEAVQTMISIMEHKVTSAFRAFVTAVEQVWESHKHLDRREFAISTQAVLAAQLPSDAGAAFNVAMNMYIGRDPRTMDMFIRSAQSRIVADYKIAVTEALSGLGEVAE